MRKNMRTNTCTWREKASRACGLRHTGVGGARPTFGSSVAQDSATEPLWSNGVLPCQPQWRCRYELS